MELKEICKGYSKENYKIHSPMWWLGTEIIDFLELNSEEAKRVRNHIREYTNDIFTYKLFQLKGGDK